MQEKVEYIRQKCIEANPEIMKRPKRFVFREEFLRRPTASRGKQMKSTTGMILGEVSILCQQHWNLSKDDLAEQSPETIDFLYNLYEEA